MATRLELANWALNRLGKDQAADLDNPTTEEEVEVALLFDQVRKELLSEGAWSFSIRRISLNSDTSYSKHLGTGDRTDWITVTDNIAWDSGTVANLVNGVTGVAAVNTPTTIAVDDYILFDFGLGQRKNIEEVKIYAQTASSFGEWTLEASDIDDDDEYEEQSVSTLDFSTTSPQTISFTPTDSAGFRFWRLRKTTASLSINKDIYEVEFKLSSGTPEWGFTNSYDLDPSVLLVNEIQAPLCSGDDYRVENGYLLTTFTIGYLTVIVDVDAESRWPPMFCKAFRLRLAQELAYAFRADKELVNQLEQQTERAIRLGLAVDGQQSRNRQVQSNSLIEDR